MEVEAWPWAAGWALQQAGEDGDCWGCGQGADAGGWCRREGGGRPLLGVEDGAGWPSGWWKKPSPFSTSAARTSGA